MRVALWFLGLFGVAVLLALFVSNNEGTITVFWPPHRVDLSLNMVVVLLGLLFLLIHLALRALAALFALPGQARSWRVRHQEQAMYATLLEALSHFVAGRFLRARKAALEVLAREAAMAHSGEGGAAAVRLRVMSYLLAAEGSQALQDKAARDTYLQQALAQSASPGALGVREGLLLRAVRWSLEDRDATSAQDWFGQLPSGVARRTVALRLRLKLARLARQSGPALDTARLLVKHRAFSDVSGRGLVRALALENIRDARDPEQLQRVWHKLESAEQAMPEVACLAAQRCLLLGCEQAAALAWLLPVWERMLTAPEGLTPSQKMSLVQVLEAAFASAVDSAWLVRIEQAQMAQPGDAVLQYLAGVACLHLELWGKAQQLIKQALPRLHDHRLAARAWLMLADLAQRQGDSEHAAAAWQQAAQLALRQDD
ncbi:MAG: heme biosynthesis HemY N-terminal domain-containing protein [Rhodoferax sp.]|uniref:heme biosynthesis protein HemY n=1 Tax=Rhodoferax sp. TaxID=50421 RepID=UPI0008BFFE2A|nr:heme biosynthesis HemY N-terminal domain-containing protein [Rhodoferax sp.]MDP2680991.1 heme biosynthesis HemY N-terminal domain-containing protein [Rhodoferax sp.]OGB80040.1 MAG: heme biosynthesis protein HemY [Burkholderiales bacterium RIFOXYC12_FULL_60_6]